MFRIPSATTSGRNASESSRRERLLLALLLEAEIHQDAPRGAPAVFAITVEQPERDRRVGELLPIARNERDLSSEWAPDCAMALGDARYVGAVEEYTI